MSVMENFVDAEPRPDEAEPQLSRLEFNHGILDDKIKETFLEKGVITHAMQGKFFYKKGKQIYTQSRDDLPKKMFIRGEELKEEDYVHLLEKFPSFYHVNEEEYTLVLMVSKQDLLITHKQIDGVQVFFLGAINNNEEFTPASVLYRDDPVVNKFCLENDIRLTGWYGEDGKIYIPDMIQTQENLAWVIRNIGSFVHTIDGIPTTYSTKEEDDTFEIFSNSQNNLQLFIRLFFINPKQGQPTKMREVRSQVEYYERFTPINKMIDFIKYIEWFKNFIEFFSTWRVCNGLTRNTIRIYLKLDNPEDVKEQERMKKPAESLSAFIRNVCWRLRQNKKEGKHGKEIHKQIEDAIYQFFCYPKNLNNCCHILKHHQKLATC